MKKLAFGFLTTGACLWAAGAMAAGTYYTGAYQSPQYRYGQPVTAQSSRYQPQQVSTPRYYPNQIGTTAQRAPYAVAPQQPAQQSGAADTGFYLSGGISREVANWQIEMKEAGSFLHYDNLSWNVFDLKAGYNFGLVKLDGGLKYGIQAGDSPMIDDDISNGGYWIDSFYWDHDNDSGTPEELLGDIFGQAISAGTSSGGSMMNFHLGLGLVDKLSLGRTKLTPSIGYRHFSHSLETNKNSGLAMDSGFCVVIPGTDETQCNPLTMVDEDADGVIDWVVWDNNDIPAGYLYQGNTYKFTQAGTSHSYDTSWSGPYLALDLEYEINQNNSVSGRVELGLPAYTSTGDQPYRPDWRHPKSVEDSASIGSAYHIGFLADWSTALTDKVMLSIGFTYDYYTISGATAKTFLDENYYGALFWNQVNTYYGGDPQAAVDAADSQVLQILQLEQDCPNWVCTAENEIDSFYKSMGIRVGLNARF